MKIANPINVMIAAEENNIVRDSWTINFGTYTGTEVSVKIKTPKPISKEDALRVAYLQIGSRLPKE
jgi:hypothetical protein